MPNPGVFFTAAYPKALPYLGDVYRSILSQTRKDFDFVVVNDGCDPLAIKDAFLGHPIILVDGVKGMPRLTDTSTSCSVMPTMPLLPTDMSGQSRHSRRARRILLCAI